MSLLQYNAMMEKIKVIEENSLKVLMDVKVHRNQPVQPFCGATIIIIFYYLFIWQRVCCMSKDKTDIRIRYFSFWLGE